MSQRSSSREAAAASPGMTTPSASSTSALPDCEVNERLPCLATRAPAPAATNAAAVEMLKVVTLPPPVPQVSTSGFPSFVGSRCIALRRARTAPTTSAAVSPRLLKPIRRADICTGVDSPRIICAKAASASSEERERRSARAWIARETGSVSAIGNSGSQDTRAKRALSNAATTCELEKAPRDRYVSGRDGGTADAPDSAVRRGGVRRVAAAEGGPHRAGGPRERARAPGRPKDTRDGCRTDRRRGARAGSGGRRRNTREVARDRLGARVECAAPYRYPCHRRLPHAAGLQPTPRRDGTHLLLSHRPR